MYEKISKKLQIYQQKTLYLHSNIIVKKTQNLKP
jgi:hypothetical protein